MNYLPTIKEETLPVPFTFKDIVNYKADEIEESNKYIVYEGNEYKVMIDISCKNEFIILKDENLYEWLIKLSSVKRILGKKVCIKYIV